MALPSLMDAVVCLSRYFGASRFLHWRRRARAIGSQLKKSDDHFVFVLSELLDGAPARFARDAIDDGLLELWSDFGIPQAFHHARQRVHQMFHEVLDPAGASAQVPLQALPHHPPAQSRSIAHGVIDLLDAQHALLDEIQHLSI